MEKAPYDYWLRHVQRAMMQYENTEVRDEIIGREVAIKVAQDEKISLYENGAGRYVFTRRNHNRATLVREGVLCEQQ